MKITFIALAAALCIVSASVPAQPLPKDYPNKPIRVVVPSPPGGPPDLIMRMIAPKMSMSMGQNLVIDNRAGAGGMVGTDFVAKAAPDGYTWLFTTASHTNTPPFNQNVPFDPVKDFSHVSLVAQNFGQALIVPPNSPAKSVQELIALARQQPGKLNYGSAGIGTASHIPAEVMKSMSGTDIVAVQYKGVAEVDHRRARRTHGHDVRRHADRRAAAAERPGAHTRAHGAKRWKGLPDVPTMQESGFKGYNLDQLVRRCGCRRARRASSSRVFTQKWSRRSRIPKCCGSSMCRVWKQLARSRMTSRGSSRRNQRS